MKLTIKYSLYLILLISILFIAGCDKEKLISLENSMKQLQEDNKKLKNENISLRKEIERLKETDQFYYQSGSDKFSDCDYEGAIEWMEKLKLRFPQSTMINIADELIEKSEEQIALIYNKEKNKLDELLLNVKKSDIEVSIKLLKEYTQGEHPSDLITIANNSLEQYLKSYELIKKEREVEYNFGVRLVGYHTGWNLHTFFGGEQLFVPNLSLKFENISSEILPIKYVSNYGTEKANEIKVSVEFLIPKDNEVYGDDSCYLVEYDDRFKPGYTKTIYITCNRGYIRAWEPYELKNLPDIQAIIYINDLPYKKIKVKKGYRS